MTKRIIYREEFKRLLSIFLREGAEIPDDWISDWLDPYDPQYHGMLQVWVVDNMKNTENPCLTGIGILKSVEYMLNFARENGNITW